MDTSAQANVKVPQNAAPAKPIAQPPIHQPVQQPVSQPAPISTPYKEALPITQKPLEFIKPSHPEVSLSPELKEHGIEEVPNPEQLQLSVEAKKAGLEAVKEAVPLQTEPTGMVQLPVLPITQDTALIVKKTRPVTDSIRWLAERVLEQVKRAHKGVTKTS